MTSKTKLYLGLGLLAFLAFAILATVIITYNRSALTPDEVVANFYDQWIDAARVSAATPLARTLHERSTYVTDAFGNSINQITARGTDGVLCLGKAPESFVLAPGRISEDGVRAAVRFTADGAEGRAVLIKDEKGWWRIDEVDCETDLSIPPAPPASTTTPTATSSVN